MRVNISQKKEMKQKAENRHADSYDYSTAQ
jgi:hypothetical protein